MVMSTIVTKTKNDFYKQRFLSENNSLSNNNLLRNLKNRILDENKNNKLKRITKILHQIDFNCWFYCNEPIYQICRKDIYEYVLNKYTTYEDKYQKIMETYSFHKVYKTIMELKSYCVHRTLSNYPFLELNEFYWKEKVFYSKKIPIYLIIHEDKEGPIHCERCKFKMTKYNYLQEYCSKCIHILKNKYYKHQGFYVQSNFKTYDFTKKIDYTRSLTCPNVFVLSDSYLYIPEYYHTTINNSTSRESNYESMYTTRDNIDDPYKIITYDHDTDIEYNDENKIPSISDTILEFISSINKIFRKNSTTSVEDGENVEI